MQKWTTIQNFNYAHEASIAQALLEEQGIQSFIQDEVSTQVMNFGALAIGGAKLQVMVGDIENAKNILIKAGILKEEKVHLLDPKNYPDETICPFCHSENIDSMVKPSALSILVYYLLRIVFFFHAVDRCQDCNKEWKYKKL